MYENTFVNQMSLLQKSLLNNIVILNEVKNLLFIIDLKNRETLHCVQGDTFLRLLQELQILKQKNLSVQNA